MLAQRAAQPSGGRAYRGKTSSRLRLSARRLSWARRGSGSRRAEMFSEEPVQHRGRRWSMVFPAAAGDVWLVQRAELEAAFVPSGCLNR